MAKICSYAGIIPAIEQTGGPEKAPRSKDTFPHFNSRLKSYLLQAGERMANVAGTDACFLRKRAEQNGQHIRRVLGKHAAAVVRALLLAERAYLPAHLYDPGSKLEERGACFVQYWPKLLHKWRGLVPSQQLFDSGQPLGRWRKTAQEAYGISLPLPGSNEKEQEQPKEPSNKNDYVSLEETVN